MIFAVIMADIKKALAPKKHIDPAIKISIYYYKDLIVFLQKEIEKLAEHQSYNHKMY